MRTVLFDCYRHRIEVLQVIEKLIEEGVSQAHIGIITPERAEQMAAAHARDRAVRATAQPIVRRFTRSLIAAYHRGTRAGGTYVGANCTLTRGDPLVQALADIGLSMSDALLGAAQVREGATLVIIYP